MDRDGGDLGARARPADRALGRGPARPRARLPPRRRRRRRGVGRRGGHHDRARLAAAPGRPTPTRSPAPTGSPSASRPAAEALSLGGDPEVADLLARVEGSRARSVGAQRGLSAPGAALAGGRLRTTRPSPRARTPGTTRASASGRPPHAGQSRGCSSTPSSSPTRQTSSRSSSTSTQAPAEAGNTTWSPGLTGIRDADVVPPVQAGTDREHDPLLRAAARRSPAGTSRPERRTRSGSSSLITTRSNRGRSWLRMVCCRVYFARGGGFVRAAANPPKPSLGCRAMRLIVARCSVDYSGRLDTRPAGGDCG